MLKIKRTVFQKTIQNNKINHNCGQSHPSKTQTQHFKNSKYDNCLNGIIKKLKKNVNQLNNYHLSLQKNKNNFLPQRTKSLNQLNRIIINSKSKQKLGNIKSVKNYRKWTVISSNQPNRKISKGKIIMKSTKQKMNKNRCIQSALSNFHAQNGSTMLSIHNCDVDEIKKAYQLTYGKQNTNIVELYNFFKRNIEKSTKILQGSTQLESLHQQISRQQQSELHKTTNFFHTASQNRFPNVIIQQKQNIIDASIIPTQNYEHFYQNQFKNASEDIYGVSLRQNPTMEQIFKNGCPDLANVFDFVKKRRVSLKNYLKIKNTKQKVFFKQSGQKQQKGVNSKQFQFQNDSDLDKQNKPVNINSKVNQQIKLNSYKIQDHDIKKLASNTKAICINKNPVSSLQQNQFNKKRQTFNKKLQTEEYQLSNAKYLKSKSSKKSIKSSSRKQKQQKIDLDLNISDQQVNQFAQYLTQYRQDSKNREKQRKSNKKQQNKEDRIFTQEFFRQINNSVINKQRIINQQLGLQIKLETPLKNVNLQNSLEGCSISVKSSSRIIELDFIALDL